MSKNKIHKEKTYKNKKKSNKKDNIKYYTYKNWLNIKIENY